MDTGKPLQNAPWPAFSLPRDCAAPLREMYDYWDGKRQERRCPSRDDLDPVDIPRLLPFICLIDVRPSEPRFVYRLVGGGVVQYFGRELTGAPVGTGVKADQLDTVIARYHDVADTMTPFYHQTLLQEENNDFSHVERLMLPLSNDQESTNMVVTIIWPWPRRLI